MPSFAAGGVSALLVVVSALVLLAEPGSLVDKLRRLVAGICAQVPSHMLAFGGIDLPLCARNTGIYTGFILGAVAMVATGRWRRVGRVPIPVLLLFLLLLTVMAGDGTNSLFTDLGWLHLYQPRNSVRLLTGTAAGLSLAALVVPAVAALVVPHPDTSPAFAVARDVLSYLLIGAVAAAATLTRWSVLLYPIAVTSSLGVIALLALINIVLLLVIGRQRGRLLMQRAVTLSCSVGLFMAVVELVGLAALRPALL